MGIEDLINLALLALVIGTMVKACRKLRHAETPAANAHREFEDCEQARRELQEFVVLFNYGATEEAYEHLRTCGFRTVEPAHWLDVHIVNTMRPHLFHNRTRLSSLRTHPENCAAT